VRIGAGVLPKELEERAGELLGALYESALNEARAALDNERKDMQALISAAQQATHDGKIRHEASAEAVARSEARADAAWEQVRALEAQLAAAITQGAAHQESLQAGVRRLDAENEMLRKRLDAEQTANAALRDRVDANGVTLPASGAMASGAPLDAAGEATVALLQLGYKPVEVSRLVQKTAADGDDAEAIIRKALRAALGN